MVYLVYMRCISLWHKAPAARFDETDPVRRSLTHSMGQPSMSGRCVSRNGSSARPGVKRITAGRWCFGSFRSFQMENQSLNENSSRKSVACDTSFTLVWLPPGEVRHLSDTGAVNFAEKMGKSQLIPRKSKSNAQAAKNTKPHRQT